MSESAEQPKTRVSMNDMAKKVTKGNKVGGIIIAICMIVLGILMFVKPIVTMIAVEYIACVGFIIYGVYQIIIYIRTPSELKNGWTLANGIIFTILGILMITSSIFSVVTTFAFLLGFLALFGGITQISSYGVFKKAGEPGAGWILASGIINIVLSLFLLLAPFAATWALEFVLAIYLIVGGIALFAESCSGHFGQKA